MTPVNGDSGIDTAALDSVPTPSKTDDEVRDLLDGYRTSDDESEEPPLKKQKLDASDLPMAKRKGRGRPPGSKNKMKEARRPISSPPKAYQKPTKR